MVAQAPTQFAIKILSWHSYAVTGGDALVEVRIPASTPLSDVSIKLNFQDVTSLFRAADAVSLRGVIGGLKLGSNVLTAGPRSGGPDPRQNICFQLSQHRVISFAQFIDLNARAGGHDIDGNLVANRTVGDPTALQLAYQTGRVNEFGAGLSSIPIIDLRSYVDTPYADGSVDVHNSYHSGVNRAQLIAINGNANN